MKRALIVAVLILLAGASLLEAQTTGINDREIQRFILPGTNTTGMRVHASRVHMSLTLPAGNIIAVGGYKVAFSYAHTGNVSVNISNAAMPVAGTAGPQGPTGPLAAGVAYQRTPFAGSVIGVAIGASAALTAGSATAEATIRQFDDAVRATGLTAVIAGTAATQFNATAQARGISVFSTTDSIGCRLTTTADIAPLTAEVVCTVIVEL